jgi:hypothetical protein
MDSPVVASRPVDEVEAGEPEGDATAAAPSSTEVAAGVLDGVWWKPRVAGVPLDIPIIVQFGPGDLFVLDGRAQLTAPVFRGRYAFTDDVVTYTDNEIVDGPCAAPGGQNRWRITVVDDGEIGTEVVEEGGCSGEEGTSAPMVRLSPVSASGAAISAPEGDFDDTFEFPSQLKGVWLRVATGEVIYFHVDGTYARSDAGDIVDSPDDRGTFVIVASDEEDGLVSVVMTSDGTSDCAAGSTLMWDAVEWNRVPPALDPPLGPIGAVQTVADDACALSSGNQTWIHISGA